LDTQEARGLLFLLRNQDRNGIWYSTQAMINALDYNLEAQATVAPTPFFSSNSCSPEAANEISLNHAWIAAAKQRGNP
jgi:hypothetical protein